MALKSSLVFSCSMLISLALFISCHATKTKTDNHEESTRFDFIKKLEGCRTGNKTKGVYELKKYLEKYGYLEARKKLHKNDDDFDDILESAVKTYQFNHHINPTGSLDFETVSKMMTPRCGVPDIVNGSTRMRASKMENKGQSSIIHTVSHFSFFPSRRRWPLSLAHLTYSFSPPTPAEAMSAVSRAFADWASATHFTFSLTQNTRNANLVIGFHRGDHGDGSPFDGRGGILAHAFAPTDGRFHYDADESWSDGPKPGSFDLKTVALHQIGHLLGLGHSSIQDAIMYPSIPSGETKGLHADDIQGIKALYGDDVKLSGVIPFLYVECTD